MLSTTNYTCQKWDHDRLDLVSLFNEAAGWRDFLRYNPKNIELLKKIEEELKSHVKRGAIIYPDPENLFRALKATRLCEVSVVILGQDPYHQSFKFNGTVIPQAMGLSFSVPKGHDIPSSLVNINKNLLKHNHISLMPKSGNLEFWAAQGCLLLNTSLTVEHGAPNCHAGLWKEFTDNLIKYISDNTVGSVFLLWGSPALQKKELIDEKIHKCIISSHPSGLSCKSRLREYPAFDNQDHFGKVNEQLIKAGKRAIHFGL